MNKIKNKVYIVALLLSFAPAVQGDNKSAASNSSSMASIGKKCVAAIGGGWNCAYEWYYGNPNWTVPAIMKDLKYYAKQKYPHRSNTIYWGGRVIINDDKKSLTNLYDIALPVAKYSMHITMHYLDDAWYITGAKMTTAENPTKDSSTIDLEDPSSNLTQKIRGEVAMLRKRPADDLDRIRMLTPH